VPVRGPCRIWEISHTQYQGLESGLPCISIPLSISHDALFSCTCRRTETPSLTALEPAERSWSSVASSPSSSMRIRYMQPVRWRRIVLRGAALAVSNFLGQRPPSTPVLRLINLQRLSHYLAYRCITSLAISGPRAYWRF